jgi:HTH-type transcriptional regulator / antitoxin HigA
MPPIAHTFEPDVVDPPGKLLEEYLEERDMSAREFGRRCGRSSKLIVEILSGKAPIEPATALQFERVLGMRADLWLKFEANYRLHLARAEEAKRWAEDQWAEQFPMSEMIGRGEIPLSKDRTDQIQNLLRFFGAGSITACNERFAELATVSYRHSPTFKSEVAPLLVWLRMGEIEGEKIECADYDKTAFLKALKKIRTLTHEPLEVATKEITKYCAEAGVAFVIIKPLKKIALSGISRWLTPRKALIQQTLRHLRNDHFWFTFFHEAAHLLLHSRKTVFLDGNRREDRNGNDKEEKEANDWAADFLIPRSDFEEFTARFDGSEECVKTFAREQGIHPGIVVGQLHHAKVIGYNKMHGLLQPYEWVEAEEP